MSLALRLIGWLALAGTILPSVFFLSGRITLIQSQTWLLSATLLWFLVSSLRYAREAA